MADTLAALADQLLPPPEPEPPPEPPLTAFGVRYGYGPTAAVANRDLLTGEAQEQASLVRAT